jgi:hypothetical protein
MARLLITNNQEDRIFLNKQENLFGDYEFGWNKRVRRALGGTWFLFKFGKNTPPVRLFCTWTKHGQDVWGIDTNLIDKEVYPVTNIITRKQLYKTILKHLYVDLCNLLNRFTQHFKPKGNSCEYNICDEDTVTPEVDKWLEEFMSDKLDKNKKAT